MLHIVGAGSGASDLITVRGKALIEKADVIIYAGSLVNPELLYFAKPGAELHDSAAMTLEEVLETVENAEKRGLMTVRLHSGDPSIYGAIAEQIKALGEMGIECDVTPGVSSFLSAAASLKAEYTLPGVSQTVILTRVEGRTPVPKGQDIASLASHNASMAIFLSTGLLEKLSSDLIEGGYDPNAPAAICYKASWPDEANYMTTVGKLKEAAKANGIESTALILIGGFLDSAFDRSLLYSPDFSHGFREQKG